MIEGDCLRIDGGHRGNILGARLNLRMEGNPQEAKTTYDLVSFSLREHLGQSQRQYYARAYTNLNIPSIGGGNTAYVGITGAGASPGGNTDFQKWWYGAGGNRDRQVKPSLAEVTSTSDGLM